MSLAINQGQAAEASQKQLKNIEKGSIDAIRKQFNEKYKPTTSLKNSYTSNPVRANFNKLIRCSKYNMAHDFGKCPAYGKECYKCRKPNHFPNCCKNRSVRCIQESDEEKDNLLIIDSIMVGQVLRKPWKELIYIQGHPVDVKLDTGVDVNILPENLIKEWPNMPLLETADCKIYIRNSIHIRKDKLNETAHTDWEKPLKLSQEQANFQDLEDSTSQHSTQPPSSGQLSSPGSPKNLTTTGPPKNWTNGSPKNLITTRSGVVATQTSKVHKPACEACTYAANMATVPKGMMILHAPSGHCLAPRARHYGLAPWG
ncbi:K02A2.6-like [Cordylochernes scorpioides]|uniref:K02A2.6-like n=1 Tax=Cordylochernes scorpioides TaxID=51811 RepID=A0ABY6K684_9ARAC|nr:K02A2.6-like [Cordylochernes scorpioides]